MFHSPALAARRAARRAWLFIGRHPVELSLFLFLWLAYGIAINSRNQFEFNLQHAGVEAIVERHQFNLEGSATPRFQFRLYFDKGRPFGDVFGFRGKQYAAKQPGQFFAGAMVYSLLHLLGLSYLRNYFLTSALVSFFTTSLVTAAAGCAVLATVREMIGRRGLFWPLASALAYGLGTTTLAYSGITHHDALASGYLTIAFFIVVLLDRRKLQGQRARALAGLAGLLLAQSLTASLLPMLMVCVVGLYLVSLRRWDLTLVTLLAGILGLTPLLFYNAVSFGNPLMTPYVAGEYRENYLYLDVQNTARKLSFYFRELALYCPIVWLGVSGWIIYARRSWREPLIVLALMIALAIPILNMDSDAGCQYGPRFLIPAMPFLAMGLGGFSLLSSAPAKWLSVLLTLFAGAASISINALGALYTVMYCDINQYGLWPAWANFRTLALKDFPLASWLAVPFAVSVVLLMYSVWKSRAASPYSTSDA